MLIKRPDTHPQAPRRSENDLVRILTEADEAACLDGLAAAGGALAGDARRAAIERLANSRDPRLQQVILNHLVPDLAETEIDPLLDLLASDQAALRNQIIDGLGQLRGEERTAALLAALDRRLADDDPDVRILALNLMTALGWPGALERVTARLETETHLNVCMTAVETIVTLGGPEHWPALQALGERFPDEPFVAFTLDAARRSLLGERGDGGDAR